MENEELPRITIDQLVGMMANGFAEMREQFATLENHLGDAVAGLNQRADSVERGLKNLSYKVDQLDAKLDNHRRETKDGFASFQAIIGSLSHTVVDHEQRIKELEGE